MALTWFIIIFKGIFWDNITAVYKMCNIITHRHYAIVGANFVTKSFEMCYTFKY